MAKQLIIGECISDGWNGFKKNAGTAIGIIVIFAIMSGIGGVIPFVNVAFNLVVYPILSAGLAIFALNVVRGTEGNIEDLFKGFNQFGSFLGAYWLYILIVFVAIIPAGIGFCIDIIINGGFDNLFPYATIAMSVVSLVIMSIALIRWSMVYYLIIDGMQVMDAFKESARITKGSLGKIFLLVLVMGLIMLLGVLLIFIGLLAAMPVCMIAFASAYTRLKT